MKPVAIIGMGLCLRDLTQEHLKIIESADILIGGKRHLDAIEGAAAQKKTITKNLSDVIHYIQDRMHENKIVVLASGDPLFYGIGSLLVNALGTENIVIYPNVTSVGGAFARIKEPWQDVKVVSLHGREHETELLNALDRHDRVVVFTDPSRSPEWVAERLIQNDYRGFQMCVCERLGSPSERVGWYSLDQAAAANFADPNVVVLKRSDIAHRAGSTIRPVRLGAPDGAYVHKKGLITKAEVRAVAISKLRLNTDHVLWDLGAGSGSISIEAALFVKRGKIFAVEKNAERIEQIKENRERFGVENLYVVRADLPEGLGDLPRPDRIFIGGGGEGLRRIITAAFDFLNPNGLIVVNTVLLENVNGARNTLNRLGCHTDLVQIQINRSRPMPWGGRLDAQNPVWIVTGERGDK